MKGVLLVLVRAYQAVAHPLKVMITGSPEVCRFHPTCSEYARQAIDKHGAWRGSWLALRRLLRCHPWGGRGHDPVPGVEQEGERGK